MKKRMRKFLSALLTLTMVFSLANFTVAAGDDDPTVVYNVSTQQFSFRNVTVYEHTEKDAHAHPQNVDLFRNMKDLMPGDSITQHIKLKVENLGSDTVTMYLRAENPNADYTTLTGESIAPKPPETGDSSSDETVAPERSAAVQAEGGGSAVATPLQAAAVTAKLEVQYGGKVYGGTLGGGIQLAEFSGNDDEREIDVTLVIPKEAGNDLQGLIAEIDWVFTVEVTPGGGGETPGSGGEEGGGGDDGTYYTVTVNYLDKDTGEEIALSYEERLPAGSRYDVSDKDAIQIPGYTYDSTTGDPLSGTLDGNKVIHVYYTKDADLPDVPTPGDPGPEEPPTDIDEPKVPLVPKTGDSSMLWLMLSAASGIGLVLLFLTAPKKKEES